ncbi:colicin V production protein [Polaribacter reichenbachii]|uniref:Colicin V production protein n=1 Tax=Polaribacter reichenbachii TaxID=996801 RepID=A0A1B8TYA7_9FLAO|nr:CvpA family protein [Polaribacter reichenbachii]APZ45866.1 colicin V production protein [Polaribacter reichenbachii]AUC19728.1 colicin V production protein [Polaribacter reichenbachii]OBY64701.1 colicin V production protein [Polaribacter reichenbachii]
MNVIDIIIAVILIFAAVRGFMTGLFSSIASLVAIVAGVFCAIHFSYYVEYELNDSVLEWSHQTNKIVAFAVTFLFVVLAIIFVGKLLTKLADITALGLLNKILGGIFGALKWSLILSVIFLLFDKFNKTIPFVDKEMLDSSVLYYPVKSIIPTLFPAIMDDENPSLKFIK